MDPIVCSNGIYPIITTQIASTNSQMICLNIDSKVKDDVEFRAVHQNQVVDRGVGWGDQPHQTWPVGAEVPNNVSLTHFNIWDRYSLSRVSVEIALSLERALAIGRIELKINSCLVNIHFSKLPQVGYKLTIDDDENV